MATELEVQLALRLGHVWPDANVSEITAAVNHGAKNFPNNHSEAFRYAMASLRHAVKS